MFPNNSRLGVRNQWRVKSEGKDKTGEQKNEEFIKEAREEIEFVLIYEWNKYKKMKRIKKEKNSKMIHFLKEEIDEWVNKWRICREENEKVLNQIKKGIEDDTITRDNSVKEKSRHHNVIKKIEATNRHGNYNQIQRAELNHARAEYNRLDKIIKKINLSDPEHLYTPEYKECRKELKKLADDRKDKKIHIAQMKYEGASTEILKKEREKLGDIVESYSVVKKIHDEMFSKELGEIKKKRDNNR
jgi:hypothetical protein